LQEEIRRHEVQLYQWEMEQQGFPEEVGAAWAAAGAAAVVAVAAGWGVV
jgi:hypothetical protein